MSGGDDPDISKRPQRPPRSPRGWGRFFATRRFKTGRSIGTGQPAAAFANCSIRTDRTLPRRPQRASPGTGPLLLHTASRTMRGKALNGLARTAARWRLRRLEESDNEDIVKGRAALTLYCSSRSTGLGRHCRGHKDDGEPADFLRTAFVVGNGVPCVPGRENAFNGAIKRAGRAYD